MNRDELFARARKSLPGGVCASTRLNVALGHPLYVERAEGSRLYDVEGKPYLDMSCGHGAALLGHGHPAVRDALLQASELGICCSSDMIHHVKLAEELCSLIPCAERVRFTNSGSEATLHAIRLCRAATGRDLIVRFTGHFHGYHEHTFIGGHVPADHLDDPSSFRESPGIPEAMTQFIRAIPFNDLGAVERVLSVEGDRVATLILEPVDFNSGGIPPQPGFLESLRELTRQHGVLLFFDEIQTSFKKSTGGAQADFGVTPDICTIGKSLGGGLALSAICAGAELMDLYRPVGEVTHSGTFMAPLPNVLSGLAFLDQVTQPTFYPDLLGRFDTFYDEVDAMIARRGIPVQVPRHGARFGILVGLDHPPIDYRDALCHRKDLWLAFIRHAFERGVYFHDYGGGPCHHGFGAAHSQQDIDSILQVMDEAFGEIATEF
ncbi:MAG TPA: aspartate aminotransferase family protein [Candidatus Latescibacteria bacterium]|nr:aspartate aminotransferase family protein [Candidatus Latescibacterota bacterium]HJP31005.1 aspartate aminotransferase family protein [Candidatus Latescibacterota bacterium]